MIRAFRFRSTGVSGRVLGIAILIGVLFIVGCTTNSAPPSPAPAITSVNTSGSAFMMGVAGTFTVTATGTPAPTFTETGALPNGLTFNAATGTISGTATGPGGSSTVTITAHNGAGPDAVQTFTVTVNQPAAITSANSTTLTVGVAGTFTVTATGFPAPTFSETGALPSGISLAASTGILSGTPAAGTGGTYLITIKAHNGAGADATQSFTLTVNQASTITSANTTTLSVNAAGTFTVLATGFPAPTLSETGVLPGGVTFVPATGKLSGTPAPGTLGTYPVTFTAHNGIGADATQIFSLIVNQAPAITSANSTAFTVALAGTFTVTATGSPVPTFSETGLLPSGVTFNTSTGVLSGTPGAGTGGSYSIVLTALNGAGANATQNFSLTVNQASAITSANNASLIVNTAGTFTVTATGFPAPTLSETGALPGGVTFTPATGKLSGTPATGTSGTYPITFTAHNGIGVDASQAFTLTVDQSAAITSTNSTTFAVSSVGTFTVTATGVPAPTLSETGVLPSGVTFNTATGILSGTAASGTGGTYSISFTAHNGVGADSVQSFTLTVNQAPTITSANTVTFVVGAAGTFTVTSTGPPAPTLSEVGALPSGMIFNTSTGVLSGTPGPGTSGTYPITFTAHNVVSPDASQSFNLKVSQAPAITSASSTTFTVAAPGTFTVTATGLPAPTFTETGLLPTGVTFNTTTGVLSGTPAAGMGGVYPISFTALNGVGSNATQNFTLSVNQAPAFTSANSATFAVNSLGTFTVTSTGPPAPSLVESGPLPAGVTFTDNGNGTGTLSGTSTVQGTFPISFTAHNGIGVDAGQSFTLTVNQAPAFSSVNNTAFTVAAAGTFTVTAGGVPAPTLSISGALPTGVTFTPATGVLGGTPGAGMGGSYSITFTAHNSSGPDATQNFTLTVNQPAAITSATGTTFSVGAPGTFMITATGFPKPTLGKTGTLPGGITFTDNGNGTATLAGTPAGGSAGNYPLTITAHNGIGADGTQPFTLTVNQSAAITSATSTTFSVGAAGTFTVTATGSPAPTLSELGLLPSGVTFTPATGVLSGTPGAGTGGSYSIAFTAHNTSGPDATQNFTLTVDQSAAISSANSMTFTVGGSGTFNVITTGFPKPTLAESGALPGGVTFTDNLNGTATLAGIPAGGSAGVYPLTLTAHNGIGSDGTQSFSLSVVVPSCTTNCTISGTVTGPWVSGIAVSISGGSPTTTDVNGHYSFSGLAGGTYTITPALAGYTYSPAAPAVTISGNTTTQDFVEAPVVNSFSISGKVSYAGSHTGRTFIRVYQTSGCSGNCNFVAEAALSGAPSSSGTPYIVRGVQPTGSNPGQTPSYIVTAEIDTLGTGEQNLSNPVGTISGITIPSANAVNVNFSVSDATLPAPVAPCSPTGAGLSIAPQSNFAVAQCNVPQDSNGIEIATSYKIYAATNSGFTNNLTVQTFPAHGTHDNVFIVSNLTNGLAYYFKMTALVGATESGPSNVVGPLSIVASSGGSTVSGTVTFPGTVSGVPMYVGVYGNGIYAVKIPNPVSGLTYSIPGVPTGTYQNFAIIDMNNNGIIDVGDISNVGNNSNPPTITVTAPAPINGNIVLSNPVTTLNVTTNHQQFNGAGETYNTNFGVASGSKRPVAVTLFSGPNVAVPYDLVVDQNNGGQSPAFLNGAIPLVGNTYHFQVTYSDGSTNPDMTASVTAVLTSFARNLLMNSPVPSASGTPATVPMLNWSAPLTPPASYTYSVALYSVSGGSNVNWYYSGGNNSNGIPSTTTNVPFNVDGKASVSPLPTTTNYDWSVTVQDANGNTAQQTTTYNLP